MSAASAYEEIRQRVVVAVERGEVNPVSGDPAEVRAAITALVRAWQLDAHQRDGAAPLTDVARMVDRVTAAVLDYGPLTALLRDPTVEEVLIRGHRLWYVTCDGQLRRPAVSEGEPQMRAYVERLLLTSSQRVALDQTNPIVSVGLPGHMRLSVKVPPVVDELDVSIRRRSRARPSLAALVGSDSLSAPAAGLLWTLMQDRVRIVVGGAPGAGKTHLVDALLGCIPLGADHVVRVNEETPELSQAVAVGGYTRTTDWIDGAGLSLRDLIKADLRFRPGWLVVGEVRGEEAYELLRPLNAGVGLLTTLHANSAADCIDALTVAASMAGQGLDPQLLRALFTRAIDVVVYCEHDSGRRQVTEIAWVDAQLRDGHVVVETLFRADDLGSPLEWTGARPPERVMRRGDRTLARTHPGATLKQVLAGEAVVGSVP
ncbi:MAG: CpaF family protein [Solirubrobacterales bacterium]|nr:CpaF family protein [Solirubrobacterales bacterium]